MYVILDTSQVKRLMMAECMDKEELSEKSGVSQNTISHMFSGKFKKVQASSLHNLAGALGVKKERLLACGEDLQERKEEIHKTLANDDERGFLSDYSRKRLQKELETLDKNLTYAIPFTMPQEGRLQV